MALRGLKLTWVCIASLFISCSIILLFKFKNSTFLLFPKHFSFCFYIPANWFYSKKTSKKIRGTGYNRRGRQTWELLHPVNMYTVKKSADVWQISGKQNRSSQMAQWLSHQLMVNRPTGLASRYRLQHRAGI